MDKSKLIDEISEQIGSEHNYICITRLRRFGKTYAAKMLAAYYEKNDSKDSHYINGSDVHIYLQSIYF